MSWAGENQPESRAVVLNCCRQSSKSPEPVKLSGIRHEGRGVTKRAPAGPKGVANGVPGAAGPVPGVVVGVELVPVDENGVLVALVVAVEEVGVLEVAPPAPVTVAVAVVAVATVVDIVYEETKKIELLRIISG